MKKSFCEKAHNLNLKMSKRFRVSTHDDSSSKRYATHIVKRSGPTKESYFVKAKSSRMDSKNLGTGRLWDLLCPPFKVKQSNYYPRINSPEPGFQAFDTGNGTLSNVVELKAIESSPGKQSFHEIPHLSCFEWTALATKCVDYSKLSLNEAIPMTGNYNLQNSKWMMMEYCRSWLQI